MAAPDDPRSVCGVGRVTVAGGTVMSAGRYALSLRFADGVRHELLVSRRTFERFSKPGTVALAQFRRGRLTLFGDLRYVESTAEFPANRSGAARDSALTALIVALAATAVAASFARGDVARRRPNDAG